MRKDSILLAFICASTIVPMAASASIEDAAIIRHIAPPPLRAERMPVTHKPGYTWSPGFWDWRGEKYEWVKGEWIKERPGYRWEAWYWGSEGDQWYFVRGRYLPVKGANAVVAQANTSTKEKTR